MLSRDLQSKQEPPRAGDVPPLLQRDSGDTGGQSPACSKENLWPFGVRGVGEEGCSVAFNCNQRRPYSKTQAMGLWEKPYPAAGQTS